MGRKKAEQIWYRALSVYMTSDSDYHDARQATLDAAADLYGGVGSKVWKYSTMACTFSSDTTLAGKSGMINRGVRT